MSAKDKEIENECFIRHKFKHLVTVSYDVIHKDEGEWQIVFKLVSNLNMKILLLADSNGNLTDWNLLAKDII